MTTPATSHLLTNSQANHLEAMAATPDGLRGGNEFDPHASPSPVGIATVLNRLEKRGLATSADWNGTTFRYTITAAGAAALLAHD